MVFWQAELVHAVQAGESFIEMTEPLPGIRLCYGVKFSFFSTQKHVSCALRVPRGHVQESHASDHSPMHEHRPRDGDPVR